MNGVRELSPDFIERLKRKLLVDTDRIQSAQVIARAIVDNRQMGKLTGLGQRIKEGRARLEARADAMGARLDQALNAADKNFDHADSILTAQDADIAGLETEVRQMSNALGTNES